MDTATAIERFIVDELLLGTDTSIDPDCSLSEAGILNSLALIRLIGFLEERFDVVVEDGDVVSEHFDSVGAIAAFVDGR